MQAAAAPLVVCGERLRFMVRDQLKRIAIEPAMVLAEPAGRGTAPALTLAAVHAMAAGDPVLLALPSDHSVRAPEAFRQALEEGAALARRGYIATFGVRPSSAHTGFGYLREGRPVPGRDSKARYVAAFVEKPDAARALDYFASGDYLWNAGIFAVRASVWIDAIGCYDRDILAACQRAYRRGRRDGRTLCVEAHSFAACPADSIDYAVMERITEDAASFEAVVVSLEAGWADVCSEAPAAPAPQAGDDATARTSVAGSP